MRHNVCTDTLGPAGVLMGDALQACVHCGFCLPTCPTYKELNQEMDRPEICIGTDNFHTSEKLGNSFGELFEKSNKL